MTEKSNFNEEEIRVRRNRIEQGIELVKSWQPENPRFDELQTDDPEMQNAIARCQRMLDVFGDVSRGTPEWRPPMGVVMLGSPGVGKTYLMKAFFRELLRDEVTVIWWRAHKLVKRIQSSYGDPSRSNERESLIERAASHDVVFVDDLGKERGSEDVETIMWELFDTIYESGSTLVLSSNFTLQEYDKAYDDAVKDRIQGMSYLFNIQGDSRRRVASRHTD